MRDATIWDVEGVKEYIYEAGTQDITGKTALMHLFFKSSFFEKEDRDEIGPLLIEQDDINAVDNEGKTALMHAIEAMSKVDCRGVGSLREPQNLVRLIAHLLIKLSPEVLNVIDKKGETALYKAMTLKVHRSDVQTIVKNIVDTLMEKGADITLVPQSGDTLQDSYNKAFKAIYRDGSEFAPLFYEKITELKGITPQLEFQCTN